MGIQKFKPKTPGLRFKQISDFEDLTNYSPEKSLLIKKDDPVLNKSVKSTPLLIF